MEVVQPRRVGEVAVLLIAAGLAEAVRAFGWASTAVMYAFALSAVVLVFWLFAFAG